MRFLSQVVSCAPFVVLLIAGCSSDNDVTVGDYVIQPYQNTPPEQSLPGQVFEDVTIRVVNSNGDPQRDLTITFTGDGTIEPASAVTSAEGTVSVRWALPETPIPGASTYAPTGPPGEYELTAAVGAESLVLHTSAHAFKADKLDAGFGHACGIVSQVLWCWGTDLNTWTTLPPTAQYATPLQFASVGPVTDVAVSSYSVCVLNTSGTPLCSATATGKVFTAVAGAPELLDLSDGDDYFCGRARDLVPWCWYTRGAAPMQATEVPGRLEFTSIGAGGGQNISVEAGGFGCGITTAGVAWCWGRNNRGQLGNGTNDDAPYALVAGDHVFTQIEVSFAGACAVEAVTNLIWCWGRRGPLAADSNIPLGLDYPGGRGPLMALGEFEAYVSTPAGTRMWNNGVSSDVGLEELNLTRISADGQLCALNPAGETYCSWILLYGGGDTFVTPGGVVAVPRPGVAPQVSTLRTDASARTGASLEAR